MTAWRLFEFSKICSMALGKGSFRIKRGWSIVFNRILSWSRLISTLNSIIQMVLEFFKHCPKSIFGHFTFIWPIYSICTWAWHSLCTLWLIRNMLRMRYIWFLMLEKIIHCSPFKCYSIWIIYYSFFKGLVIFKFYWGRNPKSEKIDKMQVKVLRPFLPSKNDLVSTILEKKDQFY